MRARQLKPGFFKNEALCHLHPLARILFEGLWCVADRCGRLEDRPDRIRVEILPYDRCNIAKLLDILVTAGFITRYVVDGVAYIQVTAFLRHQNPHQREPESTIPAPGQHRIGTGPAPDSPGAKPEPARLTPSSLTPSSLTPPSPLPESGAEGGGGETQEPEFPPDDDDPEFDAWFAGYLRKERREEARAAWDQLAPEERKKAVATVAPWWAWKQPTTEPRYWPLPENWLKKKRFNDEIPPVPAPLCTRCGKEPRLPGSETGRACWGEMGLTVPWTVEDEQKFGHGERWQEYLNEHKDLPAPWPQYLPWLNKHIKTPDPTNPMNPAKPLEPQGGGHAKHQQA